MFLRGLCVSALALLGACAPMSAAEDATVPEQWTAIEMEALPVDIGAERIGRLQFRGGIALDSEDGWWFGGISGMEVLDGERFLMISDRGDWFEGRFVLDDAGALIGATDVRTAPLRDTNGQPVDDRDDSDSEALTQLMDGRFAVSFEQRPRILIYDVNRDGPFGAPVEGPRLDGAERLPANSSLEALAIDGEGNFIVGAEGSAGSTPIWRAPIGATAPVRAAFSYRLPLGYSLTSLDRGPDGGFFAVERFYAPVIGARARITFIPDSAFEHEGDLEGVEEIASLTPPLALDNFEAIAVVRRGDSGVRIYIASDHNFSDRQRTLVYAFDLVSN